METETSTFRPPYMSFQTFWNFVEELAAKPLPPRVDRSLMGSKSGTDQNNLTMALTSFGLTDDEGRVQEALIELTRIPADQRPKQFGSLVQRYYAAPLAVSGQNGTTADLHTSFSETWPSIASADTRRKSVTFFLHAARAAGIELSVHFPQGRSGSGAPGTSKKRPTRRKAASHHEEPSGSESNGANQGDAGRTRKVTLSSGGWVTLAYDFDLFDVSNEDQDFVLGIVKMLRDYETAHVGGDS